MKRGQLSPKQVQILELKALGFSEEEIAEIMSLKLKRVEDLARGIHRKLGTPNFLASITKALDQGLIVNNGVRDFSLSSISEEEKALITFLAVGMPYKQISSKLEKLSTTVVCKRMNDLRKRFNVKNVCQLIYVTHDLIRYS